MAPRIILGISAYYHDSAAALLVDGQIKSAAQEERFTRKKHDADFPAQAICYCLKANGLTIADVDAVVYYEKPLLTFERLLETYLGAAPRGGRSFVSAMQVWLKEKLFIKTELKKQIQQLAQADGLSARDPALPDLLFSRHHLSHAAAVLVNGLPHRHGRVMAVS
jgi:carbamoyltransferase